MSILDDRLEITETRSEIVIHGGPSECSVQYEFLLSTLDRLSVSGAVYPCDNCESFHLTEDHEFTLEEVKTLMQGGIP